jgi:hypothetical protein
MYFIAVSQAFPVLFFVHVCLVVLDYGGYNMVHHKVLLKKQPHVHGHAKQADDVQVQAASLLIQAQQLAKVNKKRKQSLLNPFVQARPRPRHHRVLSIQVPVQVDRVVAAAHHQVQVEVALPIQVPAQQVEIQARTFQVQVDQDRALTVSQCTFLN